LCHVQVVNDFYIEFAHMHFLVDSSFCIEIFAILILQ
jgi:hypothetical protein